MKVKHLLPIVGLLFAVSNVSAGTIVKQKKLDQLLGNGFVDVTADQEDAFMNYFEVESPVFYDSGCCNKKKLKDFEFLSGAMGVPTHIIIISDKHISDADLEAKVEDYYTSRNRAGDSELKKKVPPARVR